MGKRLSVDEKLAAIRRLRDLEESPELMDALRPALRDRSNLIVAAAATIAGERKHISLSNDLETAFARFMVDPERTDKLCRAKVAIIQGLNNLEHDQPELFLAGASHVQWEPVWGGREDTAAPLRAASLIGLARIGYRGLLSLLVDSLVDSCKEVRIAAVQVLGEQASESANLLLRLKARTGDSEPDVVSECLLALLQTSPEENLSIAAQVLASADGAMTEAAILALGRSRLTGAFNLLQSYWQKHRVTANETIYLAIAMLRLPIANEFLLELVANKLEGIALLALSALMIYRHDPSLRQQIAAALDRSGNHNLRIKFEQQLAESE
jgi:HEAT repeat protein